MGNLLVWFQWQMHLFVLWQVDDTSLSLVFTSGGEKHEETHSLLRELNIVLGFSH